MCLALPLIGAVSSGGLGLGIAAASTALSIIGQQKQADTQNQIFQRQKQSEEAAAALRSKDRQLELRRAIGRQAAMYSASGVTMQGSPESLFQSTAREYAKEDFADRFRTQGEINTLSMRQEFTKQQATTGSIGTVMDFGMGVMRRG